MAHLGTGDDALNGNGAEQRARNMRLAGALFIFGSLFGVPSTLILTNVDPGLMLLFTALGLATGIVCLLLPWERISPAWAHVVLVVAVAEVAAVAAAAHYTFLIYFVMIGVFVSYAFPSRRVLAAYLALITLVLIGYGIGSGGDRDVAMQLAMLTIPVVLVSSILVAYLREQQEASRLKIQHFADEALELAARLRGQEQEGAPKSPAGAQAGLPAVAAPALDIGPWGRAALGFAAIALAVPLALASLAAAGVRLPEAANDAFEEAGISLPNQGGDGAERHPRIEPQRRQAPREHIRGSEAGERSGQRSGPAGGSGLQPSTPGRDEGARGGAGTPSPPVSTPTTPPGVAPGTGPIDVEPSLSDRVDQALRDTLSLLNGRQEPEE
jgi:hypothetical protein